MQFSWGYGFSLLPSDGEARNAAISSRNSNQSAIEKVTEFAVTSSIRYHLFVNNSANGTFPSFFIFIEQSPFGRLPRSIRWTFTPIVGRASCERSQNGKHPCSYPNSIVAKTAWTVTRDAIFSLLMRLQFRWQSIRIFLIRKVPIFIGCIIAANPDKITTLNDTLLSHYYHPLFCAERTVHHPDAFYILQYNSQSQCLVQLCKIDDTMFVLHLFHYCFSIRWAAVCNASTVAAVDSVVIVVFG